VTDGQTESIIANTALCIARAMLTRCKKGEGGSGGQWKLGNLLHWL